MNSPVGPQDSSSPAGFCRANAVWGQEGSRKGDARICLGYHKFHQGKFLPWGRSQSVRITHILLWDGGKMIFQIRKKNFISSADFPTYW